MDERSPPPARRFGLFAALVLALYALPVHFYRDVHTANEAIRFYLTQALVEHGEASLDRVLDRYRVGNLDLAFKDGKRYADKAPGVSLLSVPPYLALTRLGLSTEWPDLPLLRYLLHLLVIVLPAGLGVWFTYRTALDLAGDATAARRAALVLAVATPYGLYATLFFGHALAAALLAGAFHYAQRVRRGVLGERWLLVAGALAGAMVLVETPTALIGLGLAAYVAAGPRPWLRPLVYFGLGAAPLLATQLAYNAALFGGPFVFGYAHKPQAGYGSLAAEGLWGIRAPSPVALVRLLFGTHRGLFFGWPALLCALAGAGALVRRHRAEAVAALALPAAFALAISSMPDWNAGTAFAPRHLTAVLPLAVLPLALAGGRHLPLVLPGLVAIGFFSTFATAATFPYAIERFENPLFEQSLWLAAGGLYGPSLPTLLGGPAWLGPALLGALAVALAAAHRRAGAPALGPRALAAAAALPALWLGLGMALTPAQTPAHQVERAQLLSMLGPDGEAEARALCRQVACPRPLRRALRLAEP